MKNSKQSLLSYELELYKNLYESENDYRHKQSDKAFKSITIIASFVGAVLWLIFKFLKIYQDECCYLRCTNFVLLVACSALMLTCIVIFFKVLYGYNEKHIKLFGLFYKIIFIEMFLLIVTFLIEILA